MLKRIIREGMRRGEGGSEGERINERATPNNNDERGATNGIYDGQRRTGGDLIKNVIWWNN